MNATATTPSWEDHDHLANLVTALRPDWPTAITRAILQSLPGSITLADQTIAAIRWAADPTSREARGILFDGRHWAGLDARPSRPVGLVHCTVCGKTEDRCLTQRPGIDDPHPFTPPNHAVAS